MHTDLSRTTAQPVDSFHPGDVLPLSQERESPISPGDGAAPQDLALICYPILQRYARRFSHALHHSVVEDLVQEAMLAIMLHMERAREKRDPVAYLLSIGYHRMQRYVMCEDTLIHHRPDVPPPVLVSLGVGLCQASKRHPLEIAEQRATLPLPAQPPRDMSALYQAIWRLSPARRALVLHRFGLCEHPVTPICHLAPTRREQQRLSKELAGALRTLARWLSEDATVPAREARLRQRLSQRARKEHVA